MAKKKHDSEKVIEFQNIVADKLDGKNGDTSHAEPVYDHALVQLAIAKVCDMCHDMGLNMYETFKVADAIRAGSRNIMVANSPAPMRDKIEAITTDEQE